MNLLREKRSGLPMTQRGAVTIGFTPPTQRLKLGLVLMQLCLADCAIPVPKYSNSEGGCAPSQRLKGGIMQCIISSCDLDWTEANILDQTFWETNIANGKIVFTGRVKGSGFDNTDTTEDTDACNPPEVTGTTWSAKILDYNVQLSDAQDVEFYNQIVTNRNGYQVAFRTVQNYVFGFFPVTASRKLTIPPSCDNLFNREVTYSWKDILEPQRYYVPFLSELSPTAVVS